MISETKIAKIRELFGCNRRTARILLDVFETIAEDKAKEVYDKKLEPPS